MQKRKILKGHFYNKIYLCNRNIYVLLRYLDYLGTSIYME